MGDMMEVPVVVDTGAIHTMLPELLLTQIRINPMLEKSFGFADGNEQRTGVGFCRIGWQGEEAVCPFIFGPEGKYLMGATTLEIFDLAVEPGAHRLVPFPFEYALYRISASPVVIPAQSGIQS